MLVFTCISMVIVDIFIFRFIYILLFHFNCYYPTHTIKLILKLILIFKVIIRMSFFTEPRKHLAYCLYVFFFSLGAVWKRWILPNPMDFQNQKPVWEPSRLDFLENVVWESSSRPKNPMDFDKIHWKKSSDFLLDFFAGSKLFFWKWYPISIGMFNVLNYFQISKSMYYLISHSV